MAKRKRIVTSSVVAKELRKYAKDNGMSIEEMADHFGIHRSQMYVIVEVNPEKRLKWPNEEMLNAIGRIDTEVRISYVERLYELKDEGK